MWRGRWLAAVEGGDGRGERMRAYGSTGVQERLKALCGRFAAVESTARG